MIKKIAAIAAFAICLNWAGIAKAEVTSECSLSGNGDFLCTFNNKSKKKDSACIRLVLVAKNQSDTKFTLAGDVAESRDDHLQKSREYLTKGNVGSSKFDLTYAKILAANVESIEEETPRVSNFYLTNIKKIAKKSGMPLDNYINKNLPTLTALILATEGKGISNEICSGIVDANDLRERRGLAKFSGIYLLREKDLSKYNKEDLSLNELANGLDGKVRGIENTSPGDACLSRDAPWDSVCSFSINTTADMRSYLKKAILSAPDNLSETTQSK